MESFSCRTKPKVFRFTQPAFYPQGKNKLSWRAAPLTSAIKSKHPQQAAG
jgi:hypothetical protein